MTDTAVRQSPARRRAVLAGSALALALGIAAAPGAAAQGSSDALPALGGISSGALGEVAQAPAADGPSITVSQTSFPEEGEFEVTVTGTGFNDPTVLGTRPPVNGLNAGAYVVFGKFADEWKPSESGAGREVVDQKWVMPQASADAPMLVGNPQVVVVDENGDFTTTLTVSKAAADAESETGNYGIYTFAGGGVVHAPYETETRITFGQQSGTGSLAGTIGSIETLFGS